MRQFKTVAVICAAAVMMTAGAAIAGPMPSAGAGLAAASRMNPVETVVMKGTKAGKMKQRRRTRTTYCRAQPSRC